jgi:uncharacterized OsmC-like protein
MSDRLSTSKTTTFVAHEHRELVLGRQDPLRSRYRDAPAEAWIVERARTVEHPDDDPFHGAVDPGCIYGERWRIGINRAVGGAHDHPNPGDLLCAALAACFDTTLRVVAARKGVPIRRLVVEVIGELDVRGTLAVERDVPVGFQRFRFEVDLEVGDGVPDDAVERLVATAERACVILQTVRNGAPVRLYRRRAGADDVGAITPTPAATEPAARPPVQKGG